MPVQKFKPMIKDFPTFDCDAHVVEPAKLWERADEHLTQDELEALKTTMWYDPSTRELLINGKANVHDFSAVPAIGPGKIDIVRLAGPGVKHDIQRALQVRNLNAETALTQEQSEYLAHQEAEEPGPRLKDMDTQGNRPGDDNPDQHRYLSLGWRTRWAPRPCARPTTIGLTTTARRTPSVSSSPR